MRKNGDKKDVERDVDTRNPEETATQQSAVEAEKKDKKAKKERRTRAAFHLLSFAILSNGRALPLASMNFVPAFS